MPISALIFCCSSVIANSKLPPCKGFDIDSRNDCFGDITYANKNHYVGEWKAGKPNGQGTFYSYADDKFKGEKYVGGFKEGKRHGKGFLTTISGVTFVGEWKDDVQIVSRCKNTTGGTASTRYEDTDEKLLIWESDTNKSQADEVLSIANTEFLTKYRYDFAEIKINFIGQKKIYEYEAKAKLQSEEINFEPRPGRTLFVNTLLVGLPLIFGPGKEIDNAFGCTEVVLQKLIPIHEGKIPTGNSKWIESYPREINLRVSGLAKEPFERAFPVEKNSISIVLRNFIDIKKTKDNLNVTIECLSCNELSHEFINNFKKKIDAAINLASLKKAAIDEEIFTAKENKKLAAERASKEAADAKANDVFGNAKAKCADLGFKSGTDGFGKCVLQLSR